MLEILDCGGRSLDLRLPQVMGILNITPDSFSDGGIFFAPAKAVERALAMVAEGAAIIDIGGESTRPGAQPVSAQQELDRVIPVIEAIRAETNVPVSIDTSKPEVMREAAAAGAGLINDVRALREPGAVETAAEVGLPVCLMHMLGEPRTMQQKPAYENVVADVASFLAERVLACEAAGIPRDRLIVDPGFGFGKTLQHNLILLKHMTTLHTLGLPILVGMSRKTMIGAMLNVPVDERLYGGLALATIAVWQGASILRVHDVRATVEAVKVCHAVMRPEAVNN